MSGNDGDASAIENAEGERKHFAIWLNATSASGVIHSPFSEIEEILERCRKRLLTLFLAIKRFDTTRRFILVYVLLASLFQMAAQRNRGER